MEQKLYLGIELGSTRIKAVLIDARHKTAASGTFAWESELKDGYWTYELSAVWRGIQEAYRNLLTDYGRPIRTLAGIGISAMMHGYLPFDAEGNLLVPFRTWRNTNADKASKILTDALGFPIPQRWSIAHLYQAILNREPHVLSIAYLTTLSGYVHEKLTGKRILGIGDAAGMFPVDGRGFSKEAIRRFTDLIADKGYPWSVDEILPKIGMAGENAGFLTEEGAKRLDPSGALQSGIPFCPPEGDAGTGMVATCSVAERTGNVSAGTSIFAMIVLDKPLSGIYPEIDIVATPDGKPTAMVHCNSCTSDTDAWIHLFDEALRYFGTEVSKSELYTRFYQVTKEADEDCGGLLSYNYYAGEPIAGLSEGRPLVVRMPDGRLSLANFMQSLLYSSVATLKIGMDILFDREEIQLDRIAGHGGLFKTEGIGQRIMAAALRTPVSVSSSAGEGGAWGIAVLAAYAVQRDADETLTEYLDNRVFADESVSLMEPDENDAARFSRYMERFESGLPIERSAAEHLKTWEYRQ